MILRALLIIGSMLAVMPAHSELQIEVTQGADNAVKIAVVPFDWRGRGALPEEVHEIVTADLRLSGRFETLPVARCSHCQVKRLPFMFAIGSSLIWNTSSSAVFESTVLTWP